MLLFTSLTTIFISFVLLFHNWKSNKNVVYLSFLFILTSLFGLGHYFMVTGNSSFWLAIFFNHFAPFMLLFGPFLFFYVRNVLCGTAVSCKKDCFHSVPALIALIGSFDYFVQPLDQKVIIAEQIMANLNIIRTIDVNYFYDIGQSFALRSILAIVYLIYCIYLLYRTAVLEITINNMSIRRFVIAYRWIIILLISLSFIFISFTILAMRSVNSVPSKTIQKGSILYLIAGIAYCLMSFSLLFFPEILFGINRGSIPNFKKTNNPAADKNDPFYELSDMILKYLEEEKPFLNSDFSISDIAIRLKIPQIQVSYCINNLMETKFTDLKKKYRIKYAVDLLEKGTVTKLTIEAISEESGFKSRSHFYTAFKEEIGYTPSEYLEKFYK